MGFARVWSLVRGIQRNHRGARGSHARLWVEALEARWAPSVGAAFAIGKMPLADTPAVATSSNGETVAAWENRGKIYADLFNAGGRRIAGPFNVGAVVHSDPKGADGGALVGGAVTPVVAMDAHGNSVVAWYYNLDFAGGVAARLFTARGTPRGPAFRVREGLSSEADFVYNPSIAMNPSGKFLIAYGVNGTGAGAGAGSYEAKLYSAAGHLIASPTLSAQGSIQPSVAAAGNDFLVATANAPGSSSELFVSRFSSTGKALGHLVIPHPSAADSQGEINPILATDTHGNAVLVYQHFTGTAIDQDLAVTISAKVVLGPVQVLGPDSNTSTFSGVALDSGHHGFVAVQTNDDSTGMHVIITEVTNNGAMPRKIDVGSGTSQPAIAVGPGHRYLIAYTVSSGNHTAVFGRHGQL